MLDVIVSEASVFFLVFARCFAMLMTLPVFSMRGVSRIAKVALAGYMAFFLLGAVDVGVYGPYLEEEGAFSLHYLLLVFGEALIGIILGFYITIIFSAFSTAGQFLAFQMGLSAASSYDTLSQVENPLMGQFFNLVAMLVFMQTNCFQKLFLGGLTDSFASLTTVSIVECQDKLASFMVKGLVDLFSDAIVIALPVMGTLFLITACTGLLTKAAPQMNLLSEGFPILILVAFIVIGFLMPSVIDFFQRSFSAVFTNLSTFFKSVAG